MKPHTPDQYQFQYGAVNVNVSEQTMNVCDALQRWIGMILVSHPDSSLTRGVYWSLMNVGSYVCNLCFSSVRLLEVTTIHHFALSSAVTTSS